MVKFSHLSGLAREPNSGAFIRVREEHNTSLLVIPFGGLVGSSSLQANHL